MEKINVQLYGGRSVFGGRETPLEADIIYCDCKDKCSLYKNGNCLNCRVLFGDQCKKGSVETIKGYTSRAVSCHLVTRLRLLWWKSRTMMYTKSKVTTSGTKTPFSDNSERAKS